MKYMNKNSSAVIKVLLESYIIDRSIDDTINTAVSKVAIITCAALIVRRFLMVLNDIYSPIKARMYEKFAFVIAFLLKPLSRKVKTEITVPKIYRTNSKKSFILTDGFCVFTNKDRKIRKTKRIPKDKST